MSAPRLRLRLPDGTVCDAGPDTIVGRSAAARVRVDDPRVSTVHAEISWRAGGFVMLARGGRLTIDGRGERTILLAVSQVITLAPGVELTVVAIDPGAAEVVPPTGGRDRLHFVIGGELVRVYAAGAAEPIVEVTGTPGRLLIEVLRHRGEGVPWHHVAEAVWPEDAAVRRAPRGWTPIDERRFRNRWDQHAATLRRAIAAVRDGEILEMRHGVVVLRLGPLDTVEEAASEAPRT